MEGDFGPLHESKRGGVRMVGLGLGVRKEGDNESASLSFVV